MNSASILLIPAEARLLKSFCEVGSTLLTEHGDKNAASCLRSLTEELEHHVQGEASRFTASQIAAVDKAFDLMSANPHLRPAGPEQIWRHLKATFASAAAD